MAKIDVVEVKSSSDLKKFIKYPLKLYKDDPNFVAPLISERLEFFDFEKNPFYKTSKVKLFLALENGQICGRIATCVNYNHNEYHTEQCGFFGFFDCPDNYEIASTLLKTAMITLKKEKMESMRGPVSFSTNHECGFLIEGFDSPPVIMMTYNQPYLPRLAEKFGLKKSMDLMAFEISAGTPISERLVNVVEKLQKRTKVTLRNLRMKDFDNEVKMINEVYNAAWQYNWGFVPMEEEEFKYTAKNLKQVVDPDLVFIAEVDGQPIGFSLALPDMNQALKYLKGRLLPFGIPKLIWHTKIKKKIDRVRLITFGVVPQFQKRGIDSMLYVASYKAGTGKGYHNAELSWVLESNELMRSASEQMGAHIYKRYRISEMPL